MPVKPSTPARRSFYFRKKIGTGAFGEVYQAEMLTGSGFSKLVAIKLLKSEFLDKADIVARMRDEARLLGHLRHPAIVQADDLVSLAGRVAVVMEYVPGSNLLWLIKPRLNPDPLPHNIVLIVILRVAEALEAAWSRPSLLTGRPLRVLHRDIKPSNIRITPDGMVKVLDFGVARAFAMERETTTQDQLIGSWNFIAPEVFHNKPLGPASDIYALGVTMFEAIARNSFGRCGLDPKQHAMCISERMESPALGDFGDAAPRVTHLISRMLDYEPDNRPTAIQVADACRHILPMVDGPAIELWARSLVDRVANLAVQDLEGEFVGRTLDEETTNSMLDSGRWGEVRPHTDGESNTMDLPPTGSIAPHDLYDQVTSISNIEVIPLDRERAGARRASVYFLVFLVAVLLGVIVLQARHWNGRGAALPVPTAAESPAMASTESLAPGDAVQLRTDLAFPPDPVPSMDQRQDGQSQPEPGEATPFTHESVSAGSATPGRSQGSEGTHGLSNSSRVTSTPGKEPVPAPASPRTSPAPVVGMSRQGAAEPIEPPELEIKAARRILRNSTWKVRVGADRAGCSATLYWRVLGQDAWNVVSLPGAGPTWTWSLPITAMHRPALQYYVDLGGCGAASAGSSASPRQVQVR